MFGTFQKEIDEEKIVYGLTKQPEDTGALNIIFHEFKALLADVKRAPKLTDKIKYFLYPPGWSHDGSTQTAKAMQRQLLNTP